LKEKYMNTRALHGPSAAAAVQRALVRFVARQRSIAAAWQRWRRRRAAMRELQALDDHLLHDIGMYRAEIGSVVAELAGTAPATRQRTLRG
jgi:uncharacterized protein YjiS (DUF1127 family)